MVKITHVVVLAVCLAALGLWATTQAIAEPAAASPGATAIAKAAQDNKYLFIFFWREDTQQSRVMRGVFQAATKKLADKARTVEIEVADPAEAAVVARRRQPLAHAPVRGRGPQRRHHQGRGHAGSPKTRFERPLSAPARPSA